MRNAEQLQLLHRVKAGDSAAFTELCEAFHPLLTSVVEKTCHSGVSMEKDELMQEARLALYRAADAYDIRQDRVSFGLYAKICMENAMRSLLRRRSSVTGRQETRLLSWDELVETGGLAGSDLVQEPDDISRELCGLQEAEFLNQKIRRALSDFEWRVFRLYADGASAKEISDVIGRPLKSVENAIQRSITKLRYLLR